MKLLNQSIKHISISILIIIGLWGAFLFYNIVDEIKENVDEGLENYKRQIIYKAHQDTTLLSKAEFDEVFYSIQEISKKEALTSTNRYSDTLIRVQDADDPAPRLDPVRMLTTTFKDNDRYYQLKIINPMVESDDLIGRLFENMVILYIILIIAIIIINNIVLQRLWKPFYSLLTQIQHFRLGSDKAPPKITTKTKEFNDLQKAVNTLLYHNIHTYEQQKQFIGNAAHELQTPLAITINKLELLIEKRNLTDEQAEDIAETLHIIERLVRLNKSLLLLSKIENKQFIEEDIVTINKMVQETIEELSEIADFRKIDFIVEENAVLTKKMNPALAQVMIANLLRNALFHNTPDGKILVFINKNTLVIHNTGKAESLDSNKIFSRFYKSSPQAKSSGLGLAIVKAIADVYQITVTYHYENKTHVFTLQF